MLHICQKASEIRNITNDPKIIVNQLMERSIKQQGFMLAADRLERTMVEGLVDRETSRTGNTRKPSRVMHIPPVPCFLIE